MKSIIEIKKIAVKAGLLLLFSATIFSSCQDSFEYQPAVDDDGRYQGTAWDYINTIGANPLDSMTLIKELVIKAGMQDYYSQTASKRTYVIPRNKAIRADLTAATGYKSYKNIPVAKLQEVLKYHIVNGIYNTQDPQFMETNAAVQYATEATNPIFFSHNSNFQTQINYGTSKVFTVYMSNIQPTNGVIHLTSDVIYYKP